MQITLLSREILLLTLGPLVSNHWIPLGYGVEGARDIENKLWLSFWIVPITARGAWISASCIVKGRSYESPCSEELNDILLRLAV